MKLVTKLAISSVAIGGLFVGGNFLVQNTLENSVVYATTQSVQGGTTAALTDAEAYLQEISEKNVADYYENERFFASEALVAFDKKFNYDTKNMLVKDLSDEEKNYLEGLGMFYAFNEQTILKKNEPESEINGNDSLEASLADIMAMGSDDDSETPILKICQKYGVDPNGTTADLPIEAIMEISDALYEASSHPKN